MSRSKGAERADPNGKMARLRPRLFRRRQRDLRYAGDVSYLDLYKAGRGRNRFSPTGASEWPADLALTRIEAISASARATWFALLGLLAFVGVTLMGVSDADFYAYFHFYLMKLWDALGRAPAKIGADPIGERIHPWLVSDAALLLRRREGAAPKRALRWLSAIVSVALTWAFGWIVLGYALLQSLPARSEFLSLIAAAAFLFSVWVGLSSMLAALVRVAERDFARDTRFLWRARRFLLPFLLFAVATLCFTWVRTEGGLENHLGRTASRISDVRTGIANTWLETDQERWLRRRSALPQWLTTRALGTDDPDTDWEDESIQGVSRILARVDLAGAHLSGKPADWTDRDTAEKEARRKWCDRRDMNWDLCVKDPSARQRAARETWCLAPADDELDLESAACAEFFATEESAFQNEWAARRADYLSVLKKPDLSGRDLRAADLSDAFLPGVKLIGPRMEGANLSRARMEGADLSGARMKSADFSGATIGASPLKSADFTAARNLTQTQLDAAIGDQATLLPLDAETGAQLFVWSCWVERPAAMEKRLSRAPEFIRNQLLAAWLCDADSPPYRTGRSALT